jgi:hypothetical protein
MTLNRLLNVISGRFLRAKTSNCDAATPTVDIITNNMSDIFRRAPGRQPDLLHESLTNRYRQIAISFDMTFSFELKRYSEGGGGSDMFPFNTRTSNSISK